VAALVALVAVPIAVLGGSALLAEVASSPPLPTPVLPLTPLPALNPLAGLPTSPPMVIDVTHTYIASFGTRYGPVVVLLQPKWAPQTVNSFVFLADKGYWDGQYVFKRSAGAGGSYLELGDRQSTGLGAGPYALPDESPPPGVAMGTGRVAMDYQPRQLFPESANLIIFNLADNRLALSRPVGGHLPFHNIFGQVQSGLSALQQMKRGDQIFTVRISQNP
jgi:peptidyl-prolyl cis-trans isomerase B (cyclophilin B)